MRAIEQTKAILKAWLPKLKAYVPTNSHDRAVRVLDKHGIVLLLGNPASGKSTIGAILSTMAIEEEDHSVIQISSPEEFVEHWNPNCKNQFFWIDDAFGSNVVDTDYVQGWVKAFSKVAAALNGGNRFLFTSRNYIYRNAVTRLGSRNLPQFKTEAAVVNVGELSSDERRQILYNHIKHGGQDEAWKTKAKEYLNAVADIDGFLPGISERLANPDFTRKLQLTERALCDFMAKPQEHLIEVINELESEQFAALALIYVNRGRLDLNDLDRDAVLAIEEMTGCNATAILARLPELAGSFTRELSEAADQVWGFEHPTISDAITAILDTQPNMTTAIVRGGPVEKVMEQFVCENGPSALNVARIPKSLNDVLNRRLMDVANNWRTNGILFEFLASRASDEIVKHQFTHHDGLMTRILVNSSRASYSAQNRAAARAHSLGALSDFDRSEISSELTKRAVEQLDLSWLEEDRFLALIEPRTLLALGAALLSRVSDGFVELLEATRDDIDLDADIEDQYEVILSGLEILETMLSDAKSLDPKELLKEANERLRGDIREVMQKQEEHRAEQEEDGDWDVFSPSKPAPQARDAKPNRTVRSIFVDVDGVQE